MQYSILKHSRPANVIENVRDICIAKKYETTDFTDMASIFGFGSHKNLEISEIVPIRGDQIQSVIDHHGSYDAVPGYIYGNIHWILNEFNNVPEVGRFLYVNKDDDQWIENYAWDMLMFGSVLREQFDYRTLLKTMNYYLDDLTNSIHENVRKFDGAVL